MGNKKGNLLCCKIPTNLFRLPRGYQLAFWFVDFACSDNPEKRSELQKMLRALSECKGIVDYVIMPSLEMLSMESDTQKKLADEIEKSGAMHAFL
ncbi:MAG: hypothetical protein ACK5MU_04450 [Candidatus Saccharimonadales bacterium]